MLQRNFEKAKISLEQEKTSVERQLDFEKMKTERLRRLKNEMAKQKRMFEERAGTSARRLERAQFAEQALRGLQAEYDERGKIWRQRLTREKKGRRSSSPFRRLLAAASPLTIGGIVCSSIDGCSDAPHLVQSERTLLMLFTSSILVRK